MASTKSADLHDNLLGGVETTLPPHLLKPDQWLVCHNLRLTPELTQIPRKRVYGFASYSQPTQLLVLPGTVPGTGKILIFQSASIQDLNGNALIIGLVTDTNHRIWAACLYQNMLYFTNDLNPVRSYERALVDNIKTISDVGGVSTRASSVNTPPCGRYLQAWYDHLVLGHVSWNGYYPARVCWSDVNNFDSWTPQRSNEADFYDFVEWQSSYSAEVVGLAKQRGVLWVHTPDAIIPVQYVGKPKVIQVIDNAVVAHSGETFPWTLVTTETFQCFYNSAEHSFMAFNGQTVEEFGNPVKGFMEAELSTNLTYARKMHGFQDVTRSELWWVFCSNGATGSVGAFDKAVIYNYKYKRWTTADVDDIQSFLAPTVPLDPVSTLTGAVSAQTGTVSDLGVGTILPRLYADRVGRLFVDEDDGAGTLMTAWQPELVSGDMIYGSLNTTKAVDNVILNADWVAKTGEAAGSVGLEVATRSTLKEAVSYESVGEFTNPDDATDTSFNPRAGRILRYRFLGSNVKDFVATAYTASVLNRGAER